MMLSSQMQQICEEQKQARSGQHKHNKKKSDTRSTQLTGAGGCSSELLVPCSYDSKIGQPLVNQTLLRACIVGSGQLSWWWCKLHDSPASSMEGHQTPQPHGWVQMSLMSISTVLEDAGRASAV